ncbi:MAG: hypothetical protein QNJ48_05395 [Desulfobacterales bacterium]|nr:hypothetical protein [Desulfobacterales bacterium]MDJ0883571.1 hypothetical protein [Desulfobacterales bacterium]
MDTAETTEGRQLPCAKYNRYQDSRNPHCSDPALYCKYRTACLIHFMEKNGQGRDENR